MVRSIFRITLTACLALFLTGNLNAQEDSTLPKADASDSAMHVQRPEIASKPVEHEQAEGETAKQPATEPVPEPTPGRKLPPFEQPPSTDRNLDSQKNTADGFKPEFDLQEWRKGLNGSARYGEPAGRRVRDQADGSDDPAPAAMPLKFHWKPAIYQSLLAQGFQHAYALVIQEKTQRALKGPFFHDYWESIKGVRGWDDGNRFFTNYIAHPMQGAMTGFIYLQNHDRLKRQTFNESPQYWKDRAKAFVWSAAWSTNWEIGPISQASLGNVGMYGHGGWVDFVITPTVGTGWMITEEAMDRYIIRHWEEKNLATRIVLRTFLNPMRSVANVLRFKKPWYRDRAN